MEARVRRIGEKLKEGVKENGGRKRKDWWDEECEEKRKEVRRVLKEIEKERKGR